MTRIVRIRLTLEVPDDMEVQVNRDEEPTPLAVETEEPALFEGLPAVVPEKVEAYNPNPPMPPYSIGALKPILPPHAEHSTLPGLGLICPRHKKSREGKGGYFCPTVISGPGVDPKVWCDWRVKIG
jgi:hypothetical protein